jgi:hypothetical protein
MWLYNTIPPPLKHGGFITPYPLLSNMMLIDDSVLPKKKWKKRYNKHLSLMILILVL